MKCKLSGPLYLSGLGRLPGPAGFCRQPHLDRRWRNIRVWDLEALSVPKTTWKETLATQSGGHRHRPPRTPAEQSRHVFKVLSSLLCSVCGLARGEVGRTRQAAGLGRGETSVWKPPGRRALAGSVLLLRPLRTSPAALGPPRALAGWGTANKF